MNKKKKEAIILVPLIVISLIVVIGLLIPQEPVVEFETLCQEGWYKYELKSGTLCSKTELSQSQLEDYE